MHIKHNTRWSLLLLFLITSISSAFAQQRLKFRVVDFSYDAFDQTARNERFKKIDGSGSPYAIVKVCSDNSDDDLREYRFNFGNMNHIVEDHDGELWLYVQKNAKTVTISRSGYATLHHYDLNTTIESGKTYRMKLSAQGPVIYTQMVMFTITPADSKARVTIMREGTEPAEEVFGDIDETGGVANALECGTYTYKVTAMNYHSSEGRFTLDSQADIHEEKVILRPNGSNVTLSVTSNADIYINSIKRGTGSWTGMLKAGQYAVECRQANHRPSKQTISVEEGKDKTIQLTPPTPITGILAITSRPLGANIKIDSKDYGTSPKNITDILIGHHTIVISKDGYAPQTEDFDIAENETQRVNVTLEKSVVPQAATVPQTKSADGDKTFTVNGITFTMKPVAGGTFTMGATDEQGNDAESNEKPAHQVTLNDYFIGESEVTQDLWQAVMGKNPSQFNIGVSNLPVEQVSWNDCQKFIQKLNNITGQKFRLPTEAEWEYAARGGKNSKGYKYSGSNNIEDVAWHKDNSSYNTHIVKTKVPNELGIYDMSGNVWEWCSDWYGRYNSNAQSGPAGPLSGSNRILRGGCFFSKAITNRITDRSVYAPDSISGRIGLRLAMSASVDEQQNPPSVNVPNVVDNSFKSNVVSSEDKFFTVKGVTFTMKPVAGGTFTMGATPEQGSDADKDEKPVHQVTLSDYYIGETEVTQELWQAVMGNNPSKFKGYNHPVEKVSWKDCQAFIQKLNEVTGQTFRLPTEAEWEYAARGGNKSKGYKYSGSNNLNDVAWYTDNCGGTHHAVKTRQPNELDIYDMSGNVWEWCNDRYGKYKYDTQTNPTGPTNGSNRVSRGGSWLHDTWICRVSLRGLNTSGFRNDGFGFRLAMDAQK